MCCDICATNVIVDLVWRDAYHLHLFVFYMMYNEIN